MDIGIAGSSPYWHFRVNVFQLGSHQREDTNYAMAVVRLLSILPAPLQPLAENIHQRTTLIDGDNLNVGQLSMNLGQNI